MFVPDRRAIGIFGGTFDPVHCGHITLALELKNRLQLDEMRLLPCAIPPHRSTPLASAADRLQMLRLAIANTPLVIDERELTRGGPSYMADTLLSLREELGKETSLVLCMGMDAFAGLTGWHRWHTILPLAHIAVITRAGYAPALPAELAALLARHQVHDANAIKKTAAGNIYLTQLGQIPVSSTQIRQELATAKTHIDGLSPTVASYIQQRGLYLTR